MSCRSGTDEQFAEKKKILQDICDLKADAEERARVLKLAKKVETEAKKRASDLRLQAMRAARPGVPAMQFCVLFLFIVSNGGFVT